MNRLKILVIFSTIWFISCDNQIDTDKDGINDNFDNCTLVANPDQRDTDSDGCGNFCDADYDQDGVVGASDFSQFRAGLGTSQGDTFYNPNLDTNGDGSIETSDFFIFELGQAPGPSLRADRNIVACP